MVSDIETNRKIVMKVLAEARDAQGMAQLVPANILQDRTRLTPGEIDDVVNILDESGLAKAITGGYLPFHFHSVMITSKGRYDWELQRTQVQGVKPEYADLAKTIPFEYDLFICHASEDKNAIARPLAKALAKKGLRVWYDELTLTLGDSLRRKIDEGLVNSRYGVVILSPSFFTKNWPQKELDGLAAREDAEGHKVILPVWHNVDRDYVLKYSPVLADRLAVSTKDGLDAVVSSILQVVSNRESEPAPNANRERTTREIFVSYTHKDINLARRVKKELRDQGWNGFLPADDIKPRQDWVSTLQKHLESCSALFAIMTSHTTKSSWMNQEIGIAIGKSKLVIPIVFGDPKFIPAYLETVQWIRASEDNVKGAVAKALTGVPEPKRVHERTIEEVVRVSDDFQVHVKRREVENLKLIVYFDEDFPNAFIGYDEGKQLSGYLKSNGFSELGADQLEDWMRIVVSRGIAHNTSLVFAMDVIPETIFGDVDGNVPFRRYLDAGGRVLWMGDIPAWYKGKKGKREEIWQFGGFVSLLGIAPVMAKCVRPVNLTSRGLDWGLSTDWYSMRPIIVDKKFRSSISAKSAISNEPIFVLAWTQVTQGNYIFKPPRRMSRLQSIGIGMFGSEATITLSQDEDTIHNKVCASAWHMVFNQTYPTQGFLRIWDHPIRGADLTDERLRQVHSLATRYLT